MPELAHFKATVVGVVSGVGPNTTPFDGDGSRDEFCASISLPPSPDEAFRSEEPLRLDMPADADHKKAFAFGNKVLVTLEWHEPSQP